MLFLVLDKPKNRQMLVMYATAPLEDPFPD